MRKKVLLPYLFLTALLVIITFFVGVAYGKRLAEVDKIITLYNKYKPTPFPTLTGAPVGFAQYVSKGCNLKFLYPMQLQVAHQASTGASLTSEAGEKIEFSCAQQAVPTPMQIQTQITFKGKKVDLSQPDEKTYTISLSGYARTPVELSLSKNLYPLLELSLERIQ